MYTEISKQQQGSPSKNSHLKCFTTTNFDRFQRDALPFEVSLGSIHIV